MIFSFFLILGLIFAASDDPRWNIAAVFCFLFAVVAANRPLEDDDDPPL